MFPITIITFFAILTYRRLHMLNIQQRRSLSILSRQMIRMTLVQIGIVLLFMTPYAIATVYFVSTANIKKDAYHRSQDNVAQLFFLLYAYGTYSVSDMTSIERIYIHFRLQSSFYCYYTASETFRV